MSEKPNYKELEKRIQQLEQNDKALIESEQKWRNILVNIPQIGIALDPQARIVFANDHFLKLTGWKAHEIIDQDWFDLFIPENVREEVRKVFITVMSQQDTLGFSTYENQIVTRSGDLRDVAWSNVLTKDAQGHILDVTCLGIDLTERNQLEATLHESERFLSTIFDSIQDGISVLDAELNVVRVNQAMKKLYAHELPLEGKKCYEVYHGRSKPCRVCPTIRALSTGNLEMNEVPLTGKERETGILELFAFPMLDDSGKSFGVVEFVRNVTDRKRAESALRESEEKFRTLVEKSPLGISVITDDGKYKYINPQFTNIFGYTIEDVPTGNAWFKKSFPDKEYREKVIQKWIEDKKQINVGQARPRVFNVSCKDGAQKKIHFRPVTMENHDQFVIYEDITEKSILEQQLLQAQKFEAIGTLAGGIAHNFNNILMGIQGRSSLMSLELEPSHPNLEHIKSIEECVQSATGLTKQLLGFARGGKYEVKPIDINELVLNSANMFSRTRKEISIHTKIFHTQLIVDADRGQIEQVLLNLYINAWQAMPGGGELYIETSAIAMDDNDCAPFDAKPGRYARVSVTDTGIGMDENTRRRIFDPFFTTKEKSRGTGLGLASAYGIIKNHGGIITVNSKRNHGTTFNIYLQISEKEIHQEIATDRAMVKGSGTILLVDDEDMILNVSRALLEKLGYQVIPAKSGEEAIQVVLRMGSEIELVILDMIMPGMDGGTTFDRIREIHPKMPVLLSSGYAVDGQSSEILRRGCNGFLQKPFNIAKLSQKIRKIVESAKGGN
jgi:two-component system cell cycle sensor histidine kinase/response regulator CckA